MAKEKKQLGPSATYHNLDGTAPTVTVAGVVFTDGEAVDVIDELGETRGAAVLAKLAGNHFFDVDNSDADHADIREQVSRQAGVDRRKPAPRKPAVKKSVAKRIEKEDAEDDDGKAGDNGDANETDGEELPDDVDTPEAPTLENTSRPRLPRARKS